MNLRQKNLSLKILKTKKEQANESAPEKYFLIVYEHIVKCMITQRIPKLLQKNFYFFSLLYIRMSGQNINFNDKKN